MDAADVFRQVGAVVPRIPPQQQPFYPRQLPPAPSPYARLPPGSGPAPHRTKPHDDNEGDASRIAHTLTACCRCRTRKTRCDPTLPRCLPCERSGSACEYYDTAKGQKINRHYVVRLQEKVRRLEAELAQFTEGDEYPRSNEEIVRPGGLIRLSETDETPRYLGPSSGIAMTRLLMEEAKRYTDSKRISELIPDVRARRAERMNRMQSIISFGGSHAGSISRRKSYPMVSAQPVESLPTRQIVDKLVEIFNQRVQVFTPTIHEVTLTQDVDAVLQGDTDPYKNFIVRMVMAISLQKLDAQYAGLADGYYQAAMQYFEDMVRPKDIKTLQCLILIEQYSLLTPTRTAVYYIMGLATRICQQLNLTDEKRIAIGVSDAKTLDLRRRLAWTVTTCELGLATSMGRPNGFSRGNDFMDVEFFSPLSDEHITEDGIKPGVPSEKKLVAMHFCKMHQWQAQIRRTLYETKRPEPSSENHGWFAHIEAKLEEWRDSAPDKPDWCKPWFTGQYYGLILFLYRPSPQIPRPSSRAALRCVQGAQYVIDLSSQQVKKAAVDITWMFLLSVYMSLNTLLWTLSYPEVRKAHPRDEVEELVNVALDIIEQCSERWPGSASASQMYAVFARACMQSYDVKDEPTRPTLEGLTASSASQGDSKSPSAPYFPEPSPMTMGPPSRQQHPPAGYNQPPQFGYVFDATPDQMAVNMDDPFAQNHPTFRSNSIFLDPPSNMQGERRGSYFPPDFTQPGSNQLNEQSMDDSTPPATTTPQLSQATPPTFHNGHTSPPVVPGSAMLPTPPDSMMASSLPSHHSSLSPPLTASGSKAGSQTPKLEQSSPAPMNIRPSTSPVAHMQQSPYKFSPGIGQGSIMVKQDPSIADGRPNFAIPPLPQQNVQQRPLPAATNIANWFNPPAPFISPYAAFSGAAAVGPSYWGNSNNMPSYPTSGMTSGMSNPYAGAGRAGDPSGLVFDGFGNGVPQYSFPLERQGSLTHGQQLELINALENQGMQDIDAILGLGMGDDDHGHIRW